MRELELRRHSMRVGQGQHLSQEGVDLARRVGATMGRFDRVVTSALPRAFETAIAMGFAVDEQVEALGAMSADVSREADWQRGCAEFQRAARLGGATAGYVREQGQLLPADSWRRCRRAGGRWSSPTAASWRRWR